jgi:hypothetical protein
VRLDLDGSQDLVWGAVPALDDTLFDLNLGEGRKVRNISLRQIKASRPVLLDREHIG